MSSDQSFDPPTVVGHRPVGLAQPRPAGSAIHDPPTTPFAPPRQPLAAPTFVPPPAARSTGFSPSASAPSLIPRNEPAKPQQRRSASTATREVPPAALQASTGIADGSDALVAAANPLLALVAQLRDAVDFADVTQLRSEVIEQIHKFEEAAVRNGAAAGDVQAARYVLCSLIDETVMTTPWGAASDWSTSSLLNRFHNETWGGEKVFAILDRVKTDPRKNIALLKLIDFVLLLGFEGMHRVLDNGRERLADLRDEVGQLVGRNLPPPPSELSPHWQGVGAEKALRSFFPLWIVFAAAGFLLVTMYSFHRYRLAVEVAPVVERMQVLQNTIAAGTVRP
ncbi:type VI secretion system protein ImpK [Bosea sp. CRIB-10]|uniref:type IVB secretion system protein IcmH/DotU n=1 Tax=Bosea sp. CRIB-10 TaxID=378404 RepID=UPI0008EB6569|nr:type IVB secretion system protein IcmH/DotU [Bosea sp. CRIB-10]SFD12312.1 type VI secretion system protein ImpK [Bosea sp. CRIB-10]